MRLNFPGGSLQTPCSFQELVEEQFQIKMPQAVSLCSENSGITKPHVEEEQLSPKRPRAAKVCALPPARGTCHCSGSVPPSPGCSLGSLFTSVAIIYTSQLKELEEPQFAFSTLQ